MAKEILAACKRQTGARVVYAIDPENLMKELLEVYRTEHYGKPSCFCDEAGPTVVARRERAAGAVEAPKCSNCAK
jgi:hypothetical protein